jgi:hypothetical protein
MMAMSMTNDSERPGSDGGFAHMTFPNESQEYREARGARLCRRRLLGLLDTTPEGRGAEFFPKVTY